MQKIALITAPTKASDSKPRGNWRRAELPVLNQDGRRMGSPSTLFLPPHRLAATKILRINQ